MALNVRAVVLAVRLVVVKPAYVQGDAAVCVPLAVVMEMVPVQVVPAAIPDGLTETVKFAFNTPAVKLPVGERASQLGWCKSVPTPGRWHWYWSGPSRSASARVGRLRRPTVLKVSAEELKVRPDVAAAVTFRVTVADWVPVAVIMEIVPAHVVPAVSPD